MQMLKGRKIMKKIPIIIDCDPGVDDSYAIALANSSDMFEIKAITPVVGNVPAAVTRKNALCLREMLGIDCRVAFGARLPLEKEYFRTGSVTHGDSGVGTVSFPEPALAEDELRAWDVIYEEAVRRKGELILFAIGPLTNIATALRKYPDLPKYLKKFVIMGGGTFGNVSFSERTAEFNIWVDPTAAREVFRKLPVYMVGLDATHASALSSRQFDEMIEACGESEKAYLVRELSKFSKKNSMENGQDNNIIHDALAVASVLDEDVVTFHDRYVYVEDDLSKVNRGQTVVDFDSESPNCHVGMEVNQQRFFLILMEMCKHYAKQ